MSKTIPQDKNIPLNDTSDEFDTEEMDVDEDQIWLDLAVSNFNTGKTFQDAALTNQWERNADHFNSKHYRRSIYNSRQYKGRSGLFRPLTRSAERSGSAQFATAIFSNLQMTNVQPENHNDPIQVASAAVMQEILEYRLDKTIPWYLTCLGAWQDTRVYGPCCTHTSWEYAEREFTRTVTKQVPVQDVMGNDIPGKTEEVSEEVTETKIICDKPVIDMIPPENLILDPECDWRDPINTSPYAIKLKPMHLDDIISRMEEDDTKTGRQPWIKHNKAAILAVDSDKYNTVRQAREGDNRPDKTDSQERDEFAVIWAHENFVRINGQEYVYWTLGTELLLSKPSALEDVYIINKRPLSYGYSIIEAHRFSPSSATELISNLQIGINTVANLRIDNIKLALNKRYIVRRGAAVDLESLMRSVPGGGVVTDDPERDIKVVDTRDVTGSSYKEQERLETESNDLSGTFMGGSVQNNSSLNETVGGMEMLNQGANSVSEFDIRTFMESWMKPQLELLIQFIQAYETDDVIFQCAFDKAFKKLGYRYDLKKDDTLKPGERGVTEEQKEQIKNSILNDKLTIKVNVGLGATSPQKKIEMLTYALTAFEKLPAVLAKIDEEEVAKEIFAAAGFQDGARFIKDEDAEQSVEEQIEQAYQQGLDEGTDKAKMEGVKAVKEVGMAKVEAETKMRTEEARAKDNISTREWEARTKIEAQKNKTQRDVAASASKNKREEMDFKRTTGKPGI